jgi:hypothetical protein
VKQDRLKGAREWPQLNNTFSSGPSAYVGRKQAATRRNALAKTWHEAALRLERSFGLIAETKESALRNGEVTERTEPEEFQYPACRPQSASD